MDVSAFDSCELSKVCQRKASIHNSRRVQKVQQELSLPKGAKAKATKPKMPKTTIEKLDIMCLLI